ncbi:MAG: hypothetical protein A3C84_02650 [Candidatus Ryanbacteria bacterium RIFCSPHIGHO2_02_FULL_48_12]|uniref:Phosphomannomutase/phosphoglucomutase n=1 Tax=Candidatus Ryanbacteria bacterium RIFCSPHIGHO2_01_FULL_48_27 TaxID=1802115 RepID=A0A1G2G5J7_9BACT|nr:MAG: hypothetical protein A2756_01125 [Candidatus Ryanbacteria bacterium RIFCSPHIGHO2_01_FULL_48_27]OGZ49089.1 MAG: hypothetical protein A3C84_02650 [Candidatus Ryanbacteria bacterium RIFCSPHIGHO2_02_FULL_48_12]
MDINPNVFKAYDVRGIYPDEIDGFGAYRIGRAYINFLRNNPVLTGPLKIVVTADARVSSPELKRELIKGMCDEDGNITVIDAGLSTTPMHYFLINHLDADGGAMVTASHNPKEYNGIKLSRVGAAPIAAGLGMEEIKNTALRGIFETKDIHGRVVTGEYLDAYVSYLLGRVSGRAIKRFRVVFDLGNGMTALVLPHILEKLPIDAVLLCKEMDLTFPNHEANPIKDETLAMLRESIEIEHADFGVAFDGDGDRVSFTTAQGRLVPSDYILALLAEAKLREDPHPKIVFDLRTSKSVREYLENIGAIGIESRVGRSFIKDSMRTHDALLGGELSGHYFFKDFFYSDSALIAFLEVLVFLSSTQKTLDELVAPLDRYVSSGEVNIKVADTERIFDTIAAAYHDATRVSYLDGISIEYPSFWFNVRASNTEPLLRVIMEAKNVEILSTKLGELRILLKKSISLS